MPQVTEKTTATEEAGHYIKRAWGHKEGTKSEADSQE